jgi:hypothetical protein
VVGEEVAVEVELVKEEYLVVTLPQHNNALAVLPTKEWNLRLVDVHATFQPRQRLAATVFSAASPATGNRLLLSVAKVCAPSPFVGVREKRACVVKGFRRAVERSNSLNLGRTASIVAPLGSPPTPSLPRRFSNARWAVTR